ncbi:MAG TPA: hypothetical protein VNN77_17980 [candidate division Zixibacteria bacterium]|nr:hypothetical protein [candidate division Zixibacteria bacterium]
MSPVKLTSKFCLCAMGLLLSACAAGQRPVLYPDAQLKRAGTAAAEAEIDDCMRRAEEYLGRERGGGPLERAGSEAAAGAAVGAAGGAAGGAVLGRAGAGAAAGAAGGGAAGATRALVREAFRKRSPSPAYRNFVDRCLREKGYDPIGWQ